MQKLWALLLFFFPHPLNGAARRLLGQNVSKKAKIRVFSFILCRELHVGDETTISSFSILKANTISLGRHSHIAPCAIINAPLMSGADFKMGDHSRIFPFCWLEPGEGIFLGNHVGIGGHTLIFTHGAWSNYLQGGPVSYGPVTIEDHVWLPWRVFVMPKVTIGAWSIIAANSTVTTDIPGHSLAAGQPAKVLKEGVNTGLSAEKFAERCALLTNGYSEYCHRTRQTTNLKTNEIKIIFSPHNWGSGSTLILNLDQSTISGEHPEKAAFTQYLRRYGVRLASA